jgi:hypothetical protein
MPSDRTIPNKSYREGVLDANLFETIDPSARIESEWVWVLITDHDYPERHESSYVREQLKRESLFGGLRSFAYLHEDQKCINLTLN